MVLCLLGRLFYAWAAVAYERNAPPKPEPKLPWHVKVLMSPLVVLFALIIWLWAANEDAKRESR